MKNLSRKQAKLFDGVRCDSGDEYKFINDVISRYKELGVDPTTKTIVFSNALDFDKCQDIMEYCRGRIRCSFGTNDTGFKPANIVMKLTSCQMNSNQPIFGCVKLSDDAGKHTGKIEDVQRCLTDMHIEYLRKTVYGSVMSVEELNELGAQGWILCAAVKMTEAQYNYLFYKHS